MYICTLANVSPIDPITAGLPGLAGTLEILLPAPVELDASRGGVDFVLKNLVNATAA